MIAYDLITWFWQEQHDHVELALKSGERKTVVTRHVASPPPAEKDPSPLTKWAVPKFRDPSSLETFRKASRTSGATTTAESDCLG